MSARSRRTPIGRAQAGPTSRSDTDLEFPKMAGASVVFPIHELD